MRQEARDRGLVVLSAAGPMAQRTPCAQIELSDRESLLLFLAESPGEVFTREDLLGAVWGYDVPSGVRTVDSHVRALRRKLGNDLIRTVHGVGYALEVSG